MVVKDGVWVGRINRPKIIEHLGEAVLNTGMGRDLFAKAALSLSRFRARRGNLERSAAHSLWAERIMSTTGNGIAQPLLRSHNRALIGSLLEMPGVNPLREAFKKSDEAADIRRMFKSFGLENAVRLRFPREDDSPERQGDLIILKQPEFGGEKGVILISYNEAFYRAAAMFNLERMARSYRFVLEPSFWGYQDPAILLFLNLATDVIVQCQSRPDWRFIHEVGGNLLPVSFGAGDWVDDSRFSEHSEKFFDVIMVAGWQTLKRHRLLFRELAKIKDHIGHVALVGYPGNGRKASDIRREARQEGVSEKLSIYEQIPHEQVALLLQRSKVAVMLSRREGANRAFYEALFSDVPVVVTDQNRGMNHDHINSETGIMAPDDQIGEKILEVIENRDKFHPREWALRNTGARRTSETLNNLIRTMAEAQREPWTRDLAPKVNCPNASYIYEGDRLNLDGAYERLQTCERLQTWLE